MPPRPNGLPPPSWRVFNSGETALTFAVEAPKRAKVSDAELAAHLAFGATLRSYRFDRYMTKKKDDDKPSLKSIRVATLGRRHEKGMGASGAGL